MKSEEMELFEYNDMDVNEDGDTAKSIEEKELSWEEQSVEEESVNIMQDSKLTNIIQRVGVGLLVLSVTAMVSVMMIVLFDKLGAPVGSQQSGVDILEMSEVGNND